MLGLLQVCEAADVAPGIFVGAKGANALTATGQTQIGIDDGEDAVFGEPGQQARGDDVNPAKSQRFDTARGANHFSGGFVTEAASAEVAMLVEEQKARGGAFLDGESGEGLAGAMGLFHAREIDGADHVDVVEEDGGVGIGIGVGIVFEEEVSGVLEASAGVEQIFLVRDVDLHAEVVAGGEVSGELVCEVMGVDDDVVNAEFAEASESDFEQGAAVEFDEGLGAVVGERTEAGAKSGGKDHGFHEVGFSSSRC